MVFCYAMSFTGGALLCGDTHFYIYVYNFDLVSLFCPYNVGEKVILVDGCAVCFLVAANGAGFNEILFLTLPFPVAMLFALRLILVRPVASEERSGSRIKREAIFTEVRRCLH